MKSDNANKLLIFFCISISIIVLPALASGCGCGNYMGVAGWTHAQWSAYMSRFSGPTVPQFTRTSSHAGIGTYHIMIHAYFHKQWFAGNVIEKFKTAGIELNAVERVKEADYIPMGLSIKECLKFEKASVNNFIASGCIITLNTVDDLNKLKEHYLTLNAKGEFYTWSFSKDNVLIVLSGNMAEEEARQFEKALYNL